MKIYNEIKEHLTMKRVVQRYGFEPDRSDFILCPFHNEKTASLKIYDKSFYCFGCGAGGDMIKFVSMLFKIGNSQAAVRLNEDFALNLTDRKADRSVYMNYVKQKAKEKTELKAYRKEYLSKCDEAKALRKILPPKRGNNWLMYAGAQARLDYLENYWFVENRWR